MAERDDGVDAPRLVDEAQEGAEVHEEDEDEGVVEGEGDDDHGHSESWARKIAGEINTKRKSHSTEPALTDRLRMQLLEDVKNAQTYKATKVQDSPAVVTGIRMVKSTKKADYWPWLVWDGEFPRLADHNSAAHVDAAGIVAARKTDFWLRWRALKPELRPVRCDDEWPSSELDPLSRSRSIRSSRSSSFKLSSWLTVRRSADTLQNGMPCVTSGQNSSARTSNSAC